MFSALLDAINTMKNTIDDADYIINWIVYVLIIQYVKNSSHSHSIVNEQLSLFNSNGLLDAVGGNTMQNTMVGNYCSSSLEKLTD